MVGHDLMLHACGSCCNHAAAVTLVLDSQLADIARTAWIYASILAGSANGMSAEMACKPHWVGESRDSDLSSVCTLHGLRFDPDTLAAAVALAE